MKQLRYLINIELDKETRTKQENGLKTSTYDKVADYKVQLQELTDQISASIYGANVNRMYRISSPHYELEQYLKAKVNRTFDNVSLYSFLLNGMRYRIVVVRNGWIDIELMGADALVSV